MRAAIIFAIAVTCTAGVARAAPIDDDLRAVCGQLFLADAKLRGNSIDLRPLETQLTALAQHYREMSLQSSGDEAAALVENAATIDEMVANLALNRTTNARYAATGDGVEAVRCPRSP